MLINKLPSETGDDDQLDAATLKLLVELDEALRRGGDLSNSWLITGTPNAGQTDQALTSAALCLLELESAYPRTGFLKAVSNDFPTHIGRFEITGQLGAGGFGVVYRGLDPKLNRLVAIKVPHQHAFAASELRKRFVREAHAAAQLDHPHIVPIFEAGEVDDMPFIAYAYCEGPTLTRWCSDQQELMAPRQSASLMILLAEAISYSHSRGILHRDIKPSNVLLFPNVEHERAVFPFIPKLTDFGLAKVVESNLDETASHMMLGTPTFMSPEQGQGTTVGPASDVYSLGATLYYLLTGRPPFVANKLADLLRQLEEHDPVEPATLNPAVDAELNTICLKCLEKQASRRYSSATVLVDDLKRFLCGIPIKARPASTFYRIQRWCQRRPAVALLASSVCVLALGLLGTLSINGYRLSSLSQQLEERNRTLSKTVFELDQSLRFAEQQKQASEANELQARQLLYVTDVQAASEAWNKRDYSSAARLLKGHENTATLQEFSGRYLNAQLPSASHQTINLGAQIWNLALSPNGQQLAVGDARGYVHLVEVAERLTPKLSWDTGQREVNCVAYSPDAQLLATAGDDGRIGLWHVGTGENVRWLEAFDQKPAYAVEFTDNGRKLVACGNTPDLLVWNTRTFEVLLRKTTSHTRGIEALSVSPDGSKVATVGHDGFMRVYRTEGFELLFEKETASKLNVVRFDPSGAYVIAGDKSNGLHVWDATNGEGQMNYKTSDPISALATNSLSDICLTDSGGIIYHLKMNSQASFPDGDRNTLESIRVYVGDDKRLAGLALSKDGESFLTGNSKGDLERWGFEKSKYNLYLPQTNARIRHYVALAHKDLPTLYRIVPGGIESWNLPTGRRLRLWPVESDLKFCQLSRNQSRLLLGDVHGNVALVSMDALATDKRPTIRWNKIFNEHAVDQVCELRNGALVVAVTFNGDLVVFDMERDQQVAHFDNRGAFAVSPDERWLACGKGGTNELEIIELQSFQSVLTQPAHTNSIWSVRFSGDGSSLMTTSGDRSAKIWNTDDWSCRLSLLGHTDSVLSGAISPDHETFATADASGKIILWYAVSGQKLLEIASPDLNSSFLEFTQDGKSLVVGSDSGNVYVLRAE